MVGQNVYGTCNWPLNGRVSALHQGAPSVRPFVGGWIYAVTQSRTALIDSLCLSEDECLESTPVYSAARRFYP